jgi:hypothetical protein
VLPAQHAHVGIVEGIARELSWARDTLEAIGLKSETR